MIKFKPAERTLYIVTGLTIFALLSAIWTTLDILWLLISGCFIFVAFIDLWFAYKAPLPLVKRTLAGSLSVGVVTDVLLTVKNTSQRKIIIDIFDHFQNNSDVTGMPRRLLLDVNEVAELTYYLKPLMRGELTIRQLECQLLSPLGLWHYLHLLPLESHSRVYPNYAPVIKYAFLATENHLSMMGILKHRRRGQGMDFHQLREFREGDSIKQIDWKASSRMRKMIAREYQDERDQQIIVMLDCGHRMLAQDGELSHFDYSLNALLLLSYVALKQGDSIGVSTFSNESPRWIKPVKGVVNLKLLLNGIYDLQPGSAAPDYSSGAKDLILRQRKRSLVLILTNLRDDDSDDLISAVQILKKHHKVVVASLQERALVDRLEQPIQSLDDALCVAATHSYQLKRNLLVQQLRNHGINTLDVLPEKLALSLTNTYLDLKSCGQI